jgi:hypothetical protein
LRSAVFLPQVTGIAVSDRHPYMFSGSLDKEVKCWDLEYNKARQQSCLLLVGSKCFWNGNVYTSLHS